MGCFGSASNSLDRARTKVDLRKTLWAMWGTNTVLSIAAMLITSISWDDVRDIIKRSRGDNFMLKAMEANMFVSMLAILVYIVLSLLVLLRKTWALSGAGFAYGLITAASWYTALVLFLCAYNLHAHADMLDPALGDGDDTYVVTYAFMYLNSCSFFCMGCVLIFLKKAVKGQKPVEEAQPNTPLRPPEQELSAPPPNEVEANGTKKKGGFFKSKAKGQGGDIEAGGGPSGKPTSNPVAAPQPPPQAADNPFANQPEPTGDGAW